MKSKLSIPVSDFRSQPQLKETHSPKRATNIALPSHSIESLQPPPHSELEKTSSDSAPLHRTEYDKIKLLEAAAKFRLRNGIRVTRLKVIPDFLKEVKDFVPLGLSENELYKKLKYEISVFRRKPKPGPDCPDSDRSLYELESKAWAPSFRIFKPKACGSKKCNPKPDITKKKQKGAKKEKGVKKGETDSVYNLKADITKKKQRVPRKKRVLKKILDPVQGKQLDEYGECKK